MNGLLLKELYTLKKTLRTYLVVGIIYGIMAISSNNIAMFCSIFAILSIMVPVTSIAYDENCKWDSYAAALPLKKKDLIKVKFLLGLILWLFGVAVSLAMGLFIILRDDSASWMEVFGAAGVFAGLGIVYMSLLYPVIIKLGAEKGRFAYMGCILIPVVLFLILSKMGIALPTISPAQIRPLLRIAPVVVPVVLLMGLFMSYRLSIKFYSKKEF